MLIGAKNLHIPLLLMNISEGKCLWNRIIFFACPCGRLHKFSIPHPPLHACGVSLRNAFLASFERVIEGPFPTFDLYQETKIGTKLYLIFIILSSLFIQRYDTSALLSTGETTIQHFIQLKCYFVTIQFLSPHRVHPSVAGEKSGSELM